MGTIRVRYKHGSLPGDPAAFNAHGAPNGFPRVVFGGDEHDISDEELDDKEPFIMYRMKDGTEKQMTEKEYRKKLYDTGGYRDPKFNEAAPIGRNENNKNLVLLPRKLNASEQFAFNAKQKAATLKYKHFNPLCMEFLGEIEPGKEDKKDPKAKENDFPDIANMKPKDAVEYIKGVENEELLTALSIAEDKGQARPAVIMQIESQLKKLRGA